MNDQKLSVMTQQQLDDLSKFSKMPIVMIRQQKIIYVNDFFKASIDEIDFDPALLTIECTQHNNQEKERQEISIKNKSGEVYWFDCVAHDVIYQNEQTTFAFLFDITVLQEFENSIMWTSKLQELIFDIFEHILDSSTLDDFFNFVLSKALQATRNSTLGTILELKGSYLYPVASIGYDSTINSFKIPLEKSFLYTQTNGALDRIINISNASTLVDYVPVKTKNNDVVFTESVLSAPIHVNGEFYGSINLDSIERDAFNENDILALAFVRNTIEIAITNRLMYEEKVHLSYFDELTSLHNRYFFKENSDFVIKRAQRYEEVFHLIMMDIDDLKKVNDTYGHLVGDKLIQLIATTINDNIS